MYRKYKIDLILSRYNLYYHNSNVLRGNCGKKNISGNIVHAKWPLVTHTVLRLI